MSNKINSTSKPKIEVLTFNSDTKNLAKARDFVANVARNFNFSEQDLFDIKVAVGEACANSIEHGSPRGKDSLVTVTCYCKKHNLVIEISDEGRFKRNLPSSNVGERDYRGRGILLMLALMDRVSIDETEKGTKVKLTKHFQSSNKNS